MRARGVTQEGARAAALRDWVDALAGAGKVTSEAKETSVEQERAAAPTAFAARVGSGALSLQPILRKQVLVPWRAPVTGLKS
jgi:hypothetical protein